MALTTETANGLVMLATAIKAERVKIGDLAGLDTTAKADLVAAINEVLAAVGSGGSIDVDSISGSGTAGRAVIRAETQTDARTAIGAGTSNLALGTTSSTAKAGDYQPAAADIQGSTTPGRALLTAANVAAQRDALSVYSTNDTDTAINNAVAALVNGAGSTLDTLKELADALGGDANFAATTATALGNRLRFDAAQTLSGPQQQQAQDNLSVYSRAEIGDVTTDFTAILTAALA